jgi:hypothetical protein
VNSYLAGALVRETVTFTGVNGSAADPTTVTLKYRPGGGASVTTLTYAGSQVTKVSTGVYYADLDTTSWVSAGAITVTAEWIGTGACQAVCTDSFEVTEPVL